MTAQLMQETKSYLDAHHVMTLATTGEHGPWASAVFYVNTDFDFYFFTETNTRHGHNLVANPLVAAAIHEDYHDWREVKGIQLQGEAVPVGPVEKARVIALFTRKFPSVSIFLANKKTVAIVARAQVYKLVPREIWYLDNQKGFSSRQKLSIESQ